MLHVIKMQFERELYMYMGVYIGVCIHTSGEGNGNPLQDSCL